MVLFRCFLMCLTALFLYPASSFAQRLQAQRAEEIEAGKRYMELPYLVADYSRLSPQPTEVPSLPDLLAQPVEGFYFYLKQDSLTGRTLLRQPNGSYIPFVEALKLIQESMTLKPRKIMTLFLDYVVDLDIAQDLAEAGLQDQVLEYDPKQGWSSLAEMMQSNRRLVLFEVRPHVQSPSWLHAMDEHVLHTHPTWSNYRNKPEPFEERMQKTLSFSSLLKDVEQAVRSADDLNSVARRTPFLIESFKKAWIRDGIVPNFLLINQYHPWMELTLHTFRSLQLAYGIVTCNGDLLNYVNWKGMANHTTGRYYLPVEPGTELLLEPSSPGYAIEPVSRTVSMLGLKSFVGEFKARPLSIQDHLMLHFSFEDVDRSLSTKGGKAVNQGAENILDPQRGPVASFERPATIALPTAEELQMRNHDFTVTVWLKIPKYAEGKEDYCILGSTLSSYQRTLHLMIRNRKPYMGFFNNDLVGNTEIEEGKWYHIAWRYNKVNGEQAIFVNGRLDAIAEDRPPFLGSDSLRIGIGLTGDSSYFEGLMDNLGIWSRTLSGKEISGLYNQLILVQSTTLPPSVLWIGAIVAALLLLSLSYLIHHRWSKWPKLFTRETEPTAPEHLEPTSKEEVPTVQTAALPTETASPLRNHIRLFGEFSVIDREGEEIASLFTPKIKQLFLLLLIHSSRGGNGISSSTLTEQIWGGESSSKNIKSLRSVSILKLRKILERIDHVEIVFTSNRYLLQFSGTVTCDYLQCLQMLEHPIEERTAMEQFLNLISQGELFGQESFTWLDDAKSYICNSAVDVLSHFLPSYSLEEESDQLIRLADQILVNDPCNEEALIHKIQALVHQNHQKSARYTYQRFAALYEELYGEPFPQSFETLLSANSAQEASA